ncbi:Mini-ribonuclease 3 [Aureibacillus halotolerans]|uniref:Mini-ribonuclease 3 n=1 Tax=Aureibacillus halotolerans TaxID=1508390 RepID=A0A4R6TR33_9BACI|nr:ribonuclease III domain-containing protein [Aureibacillus halotolerans]TDQ34690.1 ribonuclease-3 family protein [Aureibacillus halotolerans]
MTKAIDIMSLNGVTLAYMGDAVYDQVVRHHLLELGLEKVNDLHKTATTYVSANAQAFILFRLIENDMLTNEERAVVRRGRNAKSGAPPKSADVQTYRHATGFEALLGYLYLNEENERLKQLCAQAFSFIEQRDGKV